MTATLTDILILPHTIALCAAADDDVAMSAVVDMMEESGFIPGSVLGQGIWFCASDRPAGGRCLPPAVYDRLPGGKFSYAGPSREYPSRAEACRATMEAFIMVEVGADLKACGAEWMWSCHQPLRTPAWWKRLHLPNRHGLTFATRHAAFLALAEAMAKEQEGT